MKRIHSPITVIQRAPRSARIGLLSVVSLAAACSGASGPGDSNDESSFESGGASSGDGDSSAAGGDSSSVGGSAVSGGSGGLASGGGTATGGGSGGGEYPPVSCTSPFLDPADFTSGLPLLQSNPEAGLVLFVDFDGGNYGGDEPLGAYYTGTSDQRANIVRSFNYLTQYFAMFDLSITTDASKIGPGSDAESWGWLVVSPDISGGSGQYNGIGTFTDYARAKCGDTTMTDGDRSRRIAHEFGHNLNLYHDGLFEDGVFCKFEDCSGWDGVYGSIMGGGGEGERNGWGLALYDPGHGGSDDAENLQDSMEKVRSAVASLGGATENQGWALDDHPDDTVSPLCLDGDTQGRVAVLGSPDDVDVFGLDWPGGDLHVSWSAPDVSAALLELAIYQGGVLVGSDTVTAAPAGTYEIRVRSQGDYGAIGYYEIQIEP